MKKIKLLLFFVLGVSIFSCEDAYKIEQDGEYGETVTFKNVSDMQLYLNEVYDRESILNEIKFTSIFTDEVGIGSQNAGQNLNLYKFTLNLTDDTATSIWLSHNTVINYANRLLRGATRVTPVVNADEGIDERPAYNNIIAQARALRAFSRFQLLTYFSQDLKNDNAPGIILFDDVPVPGQQLPRSTNAEVFAAIEADLTFAQSNLILRTDPNAYKFISNNFINAFKARMYAYRGQYDLAAQNADLVINTSGRSLTLAVPFQTGSIFYGAGTNNPYRRMLADFEQGEILFALDRPAGKEAIAGLFYFNRTNVSGGPFHDMGRNLFNILSSTPGDIRFNAYLDPTKVVAENPETVENYRGVDVLCIDKYPGKTGADLVNDLKVYRLSEMYFIKAEALASTGNINGASNSVASYLKSVRDARNHIAPQPLPNYASATEAWADILKERRVELAYEGHRYIDLKRLGALANVTIDRFPRDCEDNNAPVCSIPVTDFRFTLPIPSSELRGNSVIQQNPGY